MSRRKGNSIEWRMSCAHSGIDYCLFPLVFDLLENNDVWRLWNSSCQIVIPPHSILSPSETAAVGGGNIQTSQRLCDVVFKAFGAVSGGQGMSIHLISPWNEIFDFQMNVSFRRHEQCDVRRWDDGILRNNRRRSWSWKGMRRSVEWWLLDESQGFNGRSGVHVHMTNTAITDPEILEDRYGRWAGYGRLWYE